MGNTDRTAGHPCQYMYSMSCLASPIIAPNWNFGLMQNLIFFHLRPQLIDYNLLFSESYSISLNAYQHLEMVRYCKIVNAKIEILFYTIYLLTINTFHLRPPQLIDCQRSIQSWKMPMTNTHNQNSSPALLRQKSVVISDTCSCISV